MENSNSPWYGSIDGFHNNLLYGWALNVLDPNSRVVLEVFLNSEVIGSVVADVMRSDFASIVKEITFPNSEHHRLHDFCHGFVADLGSAYRAETGTLSGSGCQHRCYPARRD